MLKFIISLITVLTLIACGVNNSATLNNGKLNGLFERDTYSGKAFYYFDKEDRLSAISELSKAIEADYALYEIKKQRLGLDPLVMANRVYDVESKIENVTDTYEQAKSNLQFYDRVTKYIAEFQDTHFGLALDGLPYIDLGIIIRKYGEKYYVIAKNPKLLGYDTTESGSPTFSSINIGDEVLKYNGKDVTEAVKEFLPFSAGSSQIYRDKDAAYSLASRNFDYPEKNFVVITFKNSKDNSEYTLKMPWFYTLADYVRPEAQYFMKRNDFKSTKDLKLIWNEIQGKWEVSSDSYVGNLRGVIASNLQDVKTYTQNGSPVLITGYYLKDSKAYGVILLFTFMLTPDTELKLRDSSIKFFDALRGFVLELKAKKIPLVFDLRRNGGGNGNLPAQILALFAKTNSLYANSTWGSRITRFVRQIDEPLDFLKLPALELDPNSLSEDEYIEIYEDAIANKKLHTDFYTYGNISPDLKIGGFDENMVVLVSPYCISACDMMSMLIKSNKRAKFIGTSSNGTGAGYYSNEYYNTKWRDTYHILSTQIPNHLFGLPGDDPMKFVFKDAVMDLNSENRPTIADVQYDTTLTDLTKNDLGWLNKAVEVLNQ